MPKHQYNDKGETLSGLGLERVLYDASEKIAEKIVSSAILSGGSGGELNVWELDNSITSILNAAVISLKSLDSYLGEVLSFEIKRRRNTLIDDMISLFIESLKDAYRDAVEVDYPTPRMIYFRFWKPIENVGFIKKDFGNKVYDVLRHLTGK